MFPISVPALKPLNQTKLGDKEAHLADTSKSQSITGGSQGRNSLQLENTGLEKRSPEDWSWEIGCGELESLSHLLNVASMQFFLCRGQTR